MQMKSRHAHPPGGWMFYQPETGWTAPAWQGFDSLVSLVIQHRKANAGRFPQLSQDKATVETEVDAYNAERMRSIDGGMSFVADGGAAPPGFPTSHLLRQSVGQVVAGANKIKNAVAGIGLWMEWFGDDPVSQELATVRASTCLKCPLNIRGDVFQRFNAATGKQLLEIFGSMKKQNMATAFDDELGVCGACDCPLKAKVWAPNEIIANHLRPEAREKLWTECWMRKELSTLST
jgi:hypothetical protein